ncbi:hypothetical protein GWK47_050371 [Chionoecetes opilio]|uniref:Uncharacterized protein n=1 Tax=Chionoecetes opilio TaxID=41210 RepID=A0A8J5CSV0_CHIOP|nr:hypothetical protein GWK47_050371 [Chionoecetes opilio]
MGAGRSPERVMTPGGVYRGRRRVKYPRLVSGELDMSLLCQLWSLNESFKNSSISLLAVTTGMDWGGENTSRGTDEILWDPRATTRIRTSTPCLNSTHSCLPLLLNPV